TGHRLAEFTLPLLPGTKEPPTWSFVTVSDEYLVGGCNPLPALPLKGEGREGVAGSGFPGSAPTKIVSSSQRLTVLHPHDGRVFGTWLSYSTKHDVLIEAGRNARDTLFDEPKGIRAYRAADGKELWLKQGYVGPAMIHGDQILKDTSACDLLTGAPILRADPL